MSYARLTINTPLDATQLAAMLDLKGAAVDGPRDLERLGQWLSGQAGGAGEGLHARFVKNATRAAQTGTFTDAPSNDDTITINGVVFTAKTSGATGNQFNLGSDATEAAANLAAAVNASTTDKIQNIIYATSDAGVVTFTCLVPGAIGNLCTLSESLDNFTLTGAALTGGDEDAETLIMAGRTA